MSLGEYIYARFYHFISPSLVTQSGVWREWPMSLHHEAMLYQDFEWNEAFYVFSPGIRMFTLGFSLWQTLQQLQSNTGHYYWP